MDIDGSIEAQLREIASAIGAAAIALTAVDAEGEASLVASTGMPRELLARWSDGAAGAVPGAERGYVELHVPGLEGAWSDVPVRVPRQGADTTTLHVLRATTDPPQPAELRLIAVIAMQLGALLDRTELLDEIRAASESERSALSRLRSLYDDIQEGIVVLDDGGKVTFASRRAYRILQRSPQEVIGHGLLRFVEEEDRARLVQSFLAARSGDRASGEFRFRAHDEVRVVACTARADAADEPGCSVRMVIRDVTDDRRREQETLHREKLASVGQLAAGVAHEINNPISFVLSNYSYLARRLEDVAGVLEMYRQLARTPEAARYAGPIARVESSVEVERMLEDLPLLLRDSLDGLERVRRIVGDMRVFARKDPENPVAMEVASSIDTALGMASPALRHRAKVVREIVGTPPPIQAWPGRITQCVLNLVVNAAQACPADRFEQNLVTVRAWSDERGISISVSDTGHGIRPEDRARLFTPFFTTKAPGEGTGLGLALAWDAARRHGGNISVESTVGKGSTFTVFLPFGGIAVAPEPDPGESLASEGFRLAC